MITRFIYRNVIHARAVALGITLCCLVAPLSGCRSVGRPAYSREIVMSAPEVAPRSATYRHLLRRHVDLACLDRTPVEDALLWLTGLESLQLTSITASETESAAPVSLCMTNRPFFAVLDEMCRQGGRYWSVSGNSILTVTENALKTIPHSVREWGEPPSFLPAKEPDITRVNEHVGENGNDTPCVSFPPDIETQLKTVKIHWKYYDRMSGQDILNSFRRASLKTVKDLGGKRFSVSVKPAKTAGWHKKKHVVSLHDISIYDAFFFIGEVIGAEVSFSNGKFVFSGKDLPPEPLPKYSREIIMADHDPDLRRDMFLIVNRKTIPYVKIADMSVFEALSWLSKRQSVSVSSLGYPDAEGSDMRAKARIDLDMTNTTFLAIADEICRQSDRYWGFWEKKFMTFPTLHLKQKTNSPADTEWIRMENNPPD